MSKEEAAKLLEITEEQIKWDEELGLAQDFQNHIFRLLLKDYLKAMDRKPGPIWGGWWFWEPTPDAEPESQR